MALTYDQISAITEKKFIPKLSDNIFTAIPLLRRLVKKIEILDGGTSINVPLEYATTTSAGWYSGADTLNTADNDVISAANFSWAQLYGNITITGRDELINNGDAAKLNFVASKVKNVEKTIKDTLGGDLYNAGSDAKAIVGARAFVVTSGTYGGIATGTYSWWQGNVDTTATLSLSLLQSLWGSIQEDSEVPTVITATQANFNRYWNLLQPQQRFVDEKEANAGFVNLMFNSAPFIVDSKVPANYVYMFNENYLKLYVHKERNFKFEPFVKPINQDVRVGKILWMGALASSNNRFHGALTSVTA